MTFVPVLSNLSFAVPLLLVIGAAAVWWWWVRVAPPPRLVASPAFHSWRVNPVAAAYESMSQDRFLLAAYLLRERLTEAARVRFGVEPPHLRAWAAGDEAPALPAPLTYRRVLRDLTSAYRSAYLAERVRPSDVLASLLAPLRRRRAEREFGRAAHEVATVLAAWGESA